MTATRIVAFTHGLGDTTYAIRIPSQGSACRRQSAGSCSRSARGPAPGSRSDCRNRTPSGLGHAEVGGADPARRSVSTICPILQDWCAARPGKSSVGRHSICPVRQIHDNGSRPAQFAQPLGSNGGDAGQLRARSQPSTLSVFDSPTSGRSVPRRRDAWVSETEMRLRLARSLPGSQVEGGKRQHQTRNVLEPRRRI